MKFTVQGRINGREAVLYVRLIAEHYKRPSFYTLRIHARGKLPMNTVPNARISLSGRQWVRLEEQGVSTSKRIRIAVITEFHSNGIPTEKEATALFTNLIGGRYELHINVQGSPLGDVLRINIPF